MDVTGSVALDRLAEDAMFVSITVADDEVEEVFVETGAAALARASWCQAARWRFFSFSAGPRCRGRQGGEGGG